eukprot:3747134-Amphidinium_carterae.1
MTANNSQPLDPEDYRAQRRQGICVSTLLPVQKNCYKNPEILSLPQDGYMDGFTTDEKCTFAIAKC